MRKINRRKRRKKWPYFFAAFLCLSVVSLSLKKFQQKNSPPEKEVQKYISSTWEQFTDFQRLEMLLQGFAIESLIDIPFIQSDALKKPFLKNIRYFGIASSEGEARAMQIQYGSKMRTFLSRDITIDPLPKADLILCWDQLCAMTPSEVQAAILQFKKSGAHFLLMRHYPGVQKNQDKISGQFEPVNWTISPYNFPEPIIHIMEKKSHGMESLSLWNLDQL